MQTKSWINNKAQRGDEDGRELIKRGIEGQWESDKISQVVASDMGTPDADETAEASDSMDADFRVGKRCFNGSKIGKRKNRKTEHDNEKRED